MWEMAALAAGAAAGQMASGLIGANAAKQESERAAAQAAQLRAQALQELSGMQPIQLQELGYTPDQIDYIKNAMPIAYNPVSDVTANTISTDPATRAAQMQALQELTARSNEGLSAQDNYNFMKNKMNAETASRGAELAIEENLRQRGMGGTGVEAAMRMMNAQGTADRIAQEEAAQAASNANMRLSATQAQGQLAGNVREQDIGVAKTNADILNQLAWNNSERARQIANLNIDMKNKANQENVAEQRRVQDVNVTAKNQAQLMNKQQSIANDQTRQESIRQTAMAKAGALTGGIPDIYAGGAADSARQQQLWGTIGAAAPAAANIYLAAKQADKPDKTPTYNFNSYGYAPKYKVEGE